MRFYVEGVRSIQSPYPQSTPRQIGHLQRVRHVLEWIRSQHAFVAMMLFVLTACSSDAAVSPFEPPSSVNIPTLRQVADVRGMRIGAAADRLFRNDAEGTAFKTVLSREFSVLTPEN